MTATTMFRVCDDDLDQFGKLLAHALSMDGDPIARLEEVEDALTMATIMSCGGLADHDGDPALQHVAHTVAGGFGKTVDQLRRAARGAA